MQRLNMSRWLTHGRWNTWAKVSMTAHILLPTGLMLRIGICEVSSKSCKEDALKADTDSGVVRLGPHALDHSYTQLFLAFKDANFSVETSQIGGEPGADLVVQLTPVGGFNTSNYAMVVIPLFTDVGVDQASWRLPGTVQSVTAGSGTITAVPEGTGIATATVHGAANQQPSTYPFMVEAPQYLAWQFAAGSTTPISISTSTPRTAHDIATIISSARETEMERYAAYGELAETAEASQAGMMWNLQWSPDIPGSFAPVSRGWGNPWVIFCCE
jgi:hypothetical protein